LKDERAVLEWLLEQLETESGVSGEGIQSTPEWVEQVESWDIRKIRTFSCHLAGWLDR
jgi:hypothetical protein